MLYFQMRRTLELFGALTGLLVLGLALGRLYFLARYSELYAPFGAGDILSAYAWGVRFDLATVAKTVGPLIAIALLLAVLKRPRAFGGALYLTAALWAVLLCYQFVDIQYYAFAQRHLTFELGNTWQDTGTILKIGLRAYLLPMLVYLAALAAYMGLSVIAVRALWRRASALPTTRLSAYGAFLIAVATLLIMYRGGLQDRPIAVANAYRSEHLELGALSLNGLYTTSETIIGRMKGGALDYMDEMELSPELRIPAYALFNSPEAERPYQGYPLMMRYPAKQGQVRLNVVLLIMESWSAKFMGAYGAAESSTPNFDRLAREGLLMEQCFANAQRSLEGVPAILGSVPSWRGMVYGLDPLMHQTRMRPAPLALSASGYDTLFAHGAPSHSMRLEGLVRGLGFKKQRWLEDFKQGEASLDGVWGVYDEYLFKGVARELANMQEPFFATVYSVSSHSPYSVPSGKFEKHDKGTRLGRFLNSLEYSDQVLGEFMQSAAAAPYFERTVFIVAADHTEGQTTGENLYNAYHIPCLIYSPGNVAPGRKGGVVSQLDIAPTAMDASGSGAAFSAWGGSMLRATGQRDSGRAVLPLGEMFVHVRGQHMLVARAEGPISLVDYLAEPGKGVLVSQSPEVMKQAAVLYVELGSYLRASYEIVRDNKVAPQE